MAATDQSCATGCVRNHALSTLALLLALATPATAQISLPSLETPHQHIVYVDPAQFYLVPHMASCYENTLRWYGRLFDFHPEERTSMLFHDFGDWGYAGANNIPRNSIIVAIEPFDYNYDAMPANERMNWLMNHETTHLVTCDKTNGRDRFFRSLFQGKVVPTAVQPLSMLYSWLTSPRRYAPRWYHEGFAVFMETWTSGGMGRALGGYDEMVFRAMVRDSAYFYRPVGLESEGTTVDFQVGVNSYLYGTRFTSWLALEHGIDRLVDWFVRSDSSCTTFTAQFEKVYGEPLDREWERWIAFEHQWQESNLARIRQYPVTRMTPLSDAPLGSVSRPAYDHARHRLLCALNRPGALAQIASIDITTGSMEKIAGMPSPTLYSVASLARDDSSGRLFTTLNNSQHWRSIVTVDPATGEVDDLLLRCRIGGLAFNQRDKSLWGTQHVNGRSVLVRIPPPYDRWETVYLFPYSQGIIDIDIAPDGRHLTGTTIEASGRQKLVRLDIDTLLLGAWRPQLLHEFEGNSPCNFVHSPDGRRLYGTSHHTGVSNIWRYDLATGSMDCVTNAETGLFRPLPIGGDSIIAFTYSGQGFMPVLLRDTTLLDVNAISYLGQAVIEKHPILERWKIGSPAEIPIDSLTTYSGAYSIVGSQHVSSIIPVVEGFKDFPSYGLRLSLHDPLMLGLMNISLSYSPNQLLPHNQRLHAALDMRFWEWTLAATWNKADFYDLFGPTKTSRAGWSVSMGTTRWLVDETPRKTTWSLRAAFHGDLERLPDYQNIDASFDRMALVGGEFSTSYLRRSLGAVDDEAGHAWSISASASHVNDRVYPRITANLDGGVLTAWRHSSVWLRTSAGHCFGDRSSPFAQYYFGGFGNNWVDYLSAQRYRLSPSFPGVGINSLGGQDFARALLEWNLPPIRFRELGVISLYATWARLTLFGSALVTDPGNAPTRSWYYNGGVQMDVRIALFSILESTLSAGYALAFDAHRQIGNEFMVSLKLLK